MGGPNEETANAEDVVVYTSSTEQLTGDITSLQTLEARTHSRLLNFVHGPYRQHQFLVSCLQKLRQVNSLDTEVKGRLLRIAPNVSTTGNLVSYFLWILALCLPIVFIIVGYTCFMTWIMCCCAISLSVLVSIHSITVFFILHNHKLAKRLWFINKVQLDNYCGRENTMVEVTLDNTMSMQFLSASQKSQVIARLARSKEKKGVLMMCTKAFWTSRVLDPLLCLLVLIIISLVALIINVDLLRRHFGGLHS